jgi:hypothetical protein
MSELHKVLNDEIDEIFLKLDENHIHLEKHFNNEIDSLLITIKGEYKVYDKRPIFGLNSMPTLPNILHQAATKALKPAAPSLISGHFPHNPNKHAQFPLIKLIGLPMVLVLGEQKQNQILFCAVVGLVDEGKKCLDEGMAGG